jgi:O-succinylbenzoic acid--CoA ligase
MNKLIELTSNDNYQQTSPFIISNDVLSYGDFTVRVSQHALYLYESGIRENNVVPVISSGNPFFLISVFALWKIGAIPALINIRLTKQETDSLFEFIKPGFVLAQSGNFFFHGCRIIYGTGAPELITFLPAAQNDINRTALIIFTSGSTGKPKGVEITYGNLITSAEQANKFLQVKKNGSWLASLPFYHIGGFSIVVRALLNGSPVIIPASQSADDLCKTIEVHKPAYISLVSTQLKRLLELNCSNISGISKMLLGGGSIDEELITAAIKGGLNIIKGYGSTETSSFVAALDCNKINKRLSSGIPVGGNKIIIADAIGNELPRLSEGEILIKGETIAKGYYKNQEATADKFVNGYFHSGDIGYMDEEGYLFVVARRTDLIISGGENINPHEVQMEILKHPDIIEAVVIGIEDKTWGQTPAAVIVTKNNIQITTAELKQFLKDKLAGYKIPTTVRIIKEIPKTPLGKIQIDKLKSLL